VSGRQLAASLAGLLAGLAAFTLLLLAGLLLYQRLWGDSTAALVGLVLVGGAAGAYGGWLLGVLVYSAVRGTDGKADGEGHR
jgi:hypothetical protein